MSDNKFVVMKWQDGWREVVAVEPDVAAPTKYFVIERTEFFGRLVLDRGEGEYPGLVVTDRKPMEIESIALLDFGEAGLEMNNVYEEGGRKEHNFKLQQAGGKLVTAIVQQLERAAAERGLSVDDLMAQPETERRRVLGEIAKQIRLVGSKTHVDAIGLLEKLCRSTVFETESLSRSLGGD